MGLLCRRGENRVLPLQSIATADADRHSEFSGGWTNDQSVQLRTGRESEILIQDNFSVAAWWSDYR